MKNTTSNCIIQRLKNNTFIPLEKTAAAANAGLDYTYIYEAIISNIQTIFDVYNDSSKVNDPNIPEKHPYKKWHNPRNRYKLSDLKEHSEFWNDYNASALASKIPQTSAEKEDDARLHKFIKEVWMPFSQHLHSLDIYDDCYVLTPANSVQFPDGTNVQVPFPQIKDLLLGVSGVVDLFLSPAALPERAKVATYICNNVNRIFYMYFRISTSGPDYGKSPNKDLIIAVTRGQSKPQMFYSLVVKYVSDPNSPNTRNNFKRAICQGFKDVEHEIVTCIENENNNQQVKDKYRRELLTDTIDKYDDYMTAGLGDLASFIEASTEWANYLTVQDSYVDNSYSPNTDPVEVKIQMPYSYINVLNSIINKCHDLKVKFKFERIASNYYSLNKMLLRFSKNYYLPSSNCIVNRLCTNYKRASRFSHKMEKTAIINKNIIDAFQDVCHKTAELVSTYYYKKIIVNENTNPPEIDENQCAGIVAKVGGNFISMPGLAYANFKTILQEYNRVKEQYKNRGLFDKITDGLTNTLNNNFKALLFTKDLTIKDIAFSPTISRNTYLFKYILYHVKGVKKFSNFNEANNFMKQYTNAQYVKLEPAFNHLNTGTATHTDEHILQITVTLSKRDELYMFIRMLVDKEENKKHIINWTDVNDQLNKVPAIISK